MAKKKDRLNELTKMIKGRDFMTHTVEEYIADEMKVNGRSREEAIEAVIADLKSCPVY